MSRIATLILMAACLGGCASTGDSDGQRRGNTILTAGAAEVMASEGKDSDNLICRNERMPGSYRILRICQSTEEYEAEVAKNRALLDDWRSRGTACTSECDIPTNGGN